MRQISHALRRVVNVALQIDDAGPLMQHTLVKPLVHRARHFAMALFPAPRILLRPGMPMTSRHERNDVRRRAPFRRGDL